VIDRTFQLCPGVGPWREKDLWARGVTRWDQFPSEGVVMSDKLDGGARERIAQAREALARRDLGALARLIPEREHWRLYGEFADQAAFFDIETDGKEHERPTAVTVFAGGKIHVFLQGRNLEELPRTLARWPLWVTFNGACYDIPILQRHFASLAAPQAHLDLRFICRKMRVFGGLKEIEDKVGLSRPLHLRGVNGYDAVRLWRTFRAGADLAALRLLVEYNIYDAVQLRSLMDIAYHRVARGLGCDVASRPVFDRGEVLYDISQLLLALRLSPADQHVAQTRAPADSDVRRPRPPRYIL
jgi:uncharacterized protein